jgi:hypothetical protein
MNCPYKTAASRDLDRGIHFFSYLEMAVSRPLFLLLFFLTFIFDYYFRHPYRFFYIPFGDFGVALIFDRFGYSFYLLCDRLLKFFIIIVLNKQSQFAWVNIAHVENKKTNK